MNKPFLILLFLVVSFWIRGQELFIMHGVIGDTISQKEAYDYVLFNDLKVPNYEYAVICKLSNNYRIDFCEEDVIFPQFISQAAMDVYISNVKKLTKFQAHKQVIRDSIDSRAENVPDELTVYDKPVTTPISVFTRKELADIGLSGYVITEEGRARLERDEKESRKKSSHYVRVDNEFVQYGDTNALFQFTEPLLRKNKLNKKIREDMNKSKRE